MSPEQLLLLPLWYAAFLLSLTCHEAAHAWVAWRGGDDTAYVGGQVTLNPIPHMRREPYGTVLIPAITFLFAGWMMGWASAPYDPLWERRHPRRAALMAAAGPLANLVLAVIAFVTLKAGIAYGAWIPNRPTPGELYPIDRLVLSASENPGALEGLGRLCSIMLTLNLLLFVFNLLPFPPMDGAAIVAGLSDRARRLRDRFNEMPMAGLLGLLIAIVIFRSIFWDLYGPVVRFLWRHQQ